MLPPRRIFFQIDTDGNVAEALPLYPEIGVDVMSPFEVAAGNDLLDLARKNPDHAVPDDVSFENYLHYRRRIMELDH